MKFFKSLPYKRQFIVGLVGLSLTGLLWATHLENSLPGSYFEIDTEANLVVDDEENGLGIDWYNADGAIVNKDEPTGSDDDSFGQGAKEDTALPSVVSGSIPPNKSDLLTFGIYAEDTGSDRFVHLFWHRVQEPNGTTNMDFEFNQSDMTSTNGVTPERTAGDLLIQYDLSNGGTVPELFLSRWIDGSEGETASNCEASNSLPCWSIRENLTSSGEATGSINTGAIPAAEADIDGGPLPEFYNLGDISPRTFGEASIAFSALVPPGTGPNECISFGSAYLKSRSSDSFTAALKDFIAPLSVNISNCGSIKIIKKDDQLGDHTEVLEGAKFKLFKDIEIIGSEDATQCTARGWSASQAAPGAEDIADPIGGEKSTDDSGAAIFNNLLQGWYWVVETAAPEGHDLASPPHKCVQVVAGSIEPTPVEFVNPRTRGSIRIEKTTIGGTGTFNFVATEAPAETPIADFSRTTTVEDAATSSTAFTDMVPGETYTFTETIPSGWDATNLTCNGETDSTVTPDNANHDDVSIVLAPGENIVCTFENTKRGKIIVKKTTEGGDGTFSFTGDVAGDITTTDGLTAANAELESALLEPGTYAVAETDPSAAGFDLKISGCTDGSPANAISLQAGETVTCTFHNIKRGKIIVKKTTEGGDGTFSFTGDVTGDITTTDGLTAADAELESALLEPGTYTVAEANPGPTFDFDSASCDDSSPVNAISLQAGETVTCTFHNIKRGAIQVIKNSVGGTGIFSIHNSSIAGLDTGYDTSADNSDEDTSDPLVPGSSYEVSEVVPTGWDLTVLSCKLDGGNGSDTGTAASTPVATGGNGSVTGITVEAGKTTVCTFENTKRGAILITKTRKHAAAGGTGPHAGVEFTIFGDGLPSGGTKVTTDADGKACLDNLFLDSTYSVKETVPAGYVSDATATNDTRSVNVTQSADCGANIGKATGVSFVNLPLTKITVTVDSLIDGGTASTITCKLATTVIGNGSTAADGDGSLTLENLEPNSGPGNPYICEIYVDP